MKHAGTDMFNTVNADIYAQFATTGLVVAATTPNFAAFVDAAAALNLEDLEGTSIFAFVCPKDMAKVRKALGDDLKYVEAFAKNGYVGSVAGINLYTKKDATEGTIIVATKEAVTIFNKRGVEVEQSTGGNRSADDANVRKNTVFSRKYYVVALTDETKAVKINIAGGKNELSTATYSTNTEVDLSSMTKDELLAYAEENGIEGVSSSMLKSEIYEIIVNSVMSE